MYAALERLAGEWTHTITINGEDYEALYQKLLS
jgi:hypothetical protein